MAPSDKAHVNDLIAFISRRIAGNLPGRRLELISQGSDYGAGRVEPRTRKTLPSLRSAILLATTREVSALRTYQLQSISLT